VKRRHLFFLILALPTLGIAIWQWWPRPYDPAQDTSASCRIDFTRLTRDLSYHWLDVHLKVDDPQSFQLDRRWQLETSADARRQPAGLTLEGSGSKVDSPDSPGMALTEALTVRFWLEPGDLDGPLTLLIGEARLPIRHGRDTPALDDGEARLFRDSDW
jgi:hypothetical protein